MYCLQWDAPLTFYSSGKEEYDLLGTVHNNWFIFRFHIQMSVILLQFIQSSRGNENAERIPAPMKH